MAIFSSADNNRSFDSNFEGSDHGEETISTAESSPDLEDDEEIRRAFDDLRKQIGNSSGFSKVHYESQVISQPLPTEEVDNPRKGVYYFILHTLLMSANSYVASALFSLNPSVSVVQLTFCRGIIASLMILALINVNIKKTLVDSIDRDSLPSLIFRCT